MLQAELGSRAEGSRDELAELGNQAELGSQVSGTETDSLDTACLVPALQLRSVLAAVLLAFEVGSDRTEERPNATRKRCLVAAEARAFQTSGPEEATALVA